VKAVVVIPTYNEVATIAALLEKLLHVTAEDNDVLVVDDGSPDGTAAAVAEIQRARRRVHLIQRGTKHGLASAYVEAFGWALARAYDAVVEMDGDLSHDPVVVPQLLAQLDDADLVIGSRYMPGGSIENWGRFRRVLSRAGNFYARAWLGWPVRDATSGFRAYRRAALEALNLGALRSDGYAFQIEMTHRVFTGGGRIREWPITFSERRFGRSKLSRRIVLEALVSVPVWGLKRRLGARLRAR
jgi:dolichol-phosphate mannosyltransferase